MAIRTHSPKTMNQPDPPQIGHITSSETHPTSGPGASESTRSREFSLLSLAYILARRPLPDSTLSNTGSSSPGVLSQRSNGLSPDRVRIRVGVEGRLKNPGRKEIGLRGEQNPEPIWTPHAWGLKLVPKFPICRFLIEKASSLTELAPSGDMGGESDGGDKGGEYKVEVGEEPNEPLAVYES